MPGKISRFARGLFILLSAGLILSSSYQALASSADLKTYPVPGRLIDVGGIGYISIVRARENRPSYWRRA